MSIIKKIFFLSVLILAMSLLFWGVYNLSFKKTTAPVAQEPAPTVEAPAIPKTLPQIAAISDEAVISPVLTGDGSQIKYYSRATGQVYEIDLDGGNKSTLASTELPGINNIFWSEDGTKVISKFIKPDGMQFFYYDYTTQKGTPLKKNVDEIAWQTSGNKIFYKYYDEQTKKRSLNISDPDGSGWSKLADIDYRNVSIAQIPQSGLVSFWNSPDALTETIFTSVPLIAGEKKTIFQGKFGADYLWSPDGSLALVSHTDVRGGSKMQLATMNYNGGEYKNLDAPTFVSKCAWSKDNKTIYYALPGGIPPSAILPNEYNEGKITTTDTFWKINIETGEKARLIETDKIGNKYDTTQIFLNADESKLFFTNKIDGKLYRIDL